MNAVIECNTSNNLLYCAHIQMSILDRLLNTSPERIAAIPSKGRFAPSPSGRMHLGNIYAALMSYISAKANGGSWLLRIEDIDTQRSRRKWADMIMSDLDWLGLGWDEGPVYQSERTEVYEGALKDLSDMGLVYPCTCTRAELMASRAPHATDGHIPYAGRCRPMSPCFGAGLLPATLRVMVPPYPSGHAFPSSPDVVVRFDDRICGPQEVDLSANFGDFVLRRRDGSWAYQLAVAVDDAMMGVTEVVRGDDLLLSTAPQRYLTSLLGLVSPQSYAHLPLLKNADGLRLSKRDGAMSMEYLRASYGPSEVVAMVCQAASVDSEEMLSLLRAYA